MSYCAWYTQVNRAPNFDPQGAFMADIWAYYAAYSERGRLPKGLSEYHECSSLRGEPSSAPSSEPILRRRRGKRRIVRGQLGPSVGQTRKRQRESPTEESA